jgi:hypothetical protein
MTSDIRLRIPKTTGVVHAFATFEQDHHLLQMADQFTLHHEHLVGHL